MKWRRKCNGLDNNKIEMNSTTTTAETKRKSGRNIMQSWILVICCWLECDFIIIEDCLQSFSLLFFIILVWHELFLSYDYWGTLSFCGILLSWVVKSCSFFKQSYNKTMESLSFEGEIVQQLVNESERESGIKKIHHGINPSASKQALALLSLLSHHPVIILLLIIIMVFIISILFLFHWVVWRIHPSLSHHLKDQRYTIRVPLILQSCGVRNKNKQQKLMAHQRNHLFNFSSSLMTGKCM